MQSTYTTYILVIVAVFVGGMALIMYLQGQSEEAFSQHETRNEELKQLLLGIQDDDHIVGNTDARVAVIEYADSDCQFCAALMPKMERMISEYAPQDVVWVYRHSQLPIYPYSDKEAEAMECVADLSGEETYREYRRIMYAHTLTGDDDDKDGTHLSNVAVNLGLDRFSFYDCYIERQFKEYVQSQKDTGATLKVSTVPHVFIVNTSTGEVFEVVGNKPYDIYQTVIDSFLST